MNETAAWFVLTVIIDTGGTHTRMNVPEAEQPDDDWLDWLGE